MYCGALVADDVVDCHLNIFKAFHEVITNRLVALLLFNGVVDGGLHLRDSLNKLRWGGNCYVTVLGGDGDCWC